MKKLYVSKVAIEKKGLAFFENLKCYDLKFSNFGVFNIDGYNDGFKYKGFGLSRGDLYFYDNSQKEEVILIKEI